MSFSSIAGPCTQPVATARTPPNFRWRSLIMPRTISRPLERAPHLCLRYRCKDTGLFRSPSHQLSQLLRKRRGSPSRRMCRSHTGSLLFCALISTSASVSAERLHKYLVNVDPDLSAGSVHACFAGRAPERLVAESLDASLALERALRMGARKPLEPNGTELRLGAQPDDSCIDYRVNLLEFSGRHQRGGNPTRRVGSDLITDLGLWFWRPETLAEDEDIEVTFTLLEGISVSAPWQRTPAGAGKGGFRVGRTPNDWPGTVAFGHFTEHTVLVPGGELQVAVLDGRPRLNEAQIIDWLQ